MKLRVLLLFLLGFILCSLPVLADANSYYYDANNRLIQVNEYGHSFKYVYNQQGGLQKVVKDANLHVNQGFESKGDGQIADHWGYWKSTDVTGSYVLDTTSPFAGHASQRIAAQSIPEGGMNVYQDIRVVPKGTYYLSAQMKVDQIQNADVTIVIHYFDDKYNLVGSAEPARLSKIMSWTGISGNVVIPDGAVRARVHFHAQKQSNYGDSKADFTIDEVVFQKEKPRSFIFNHSFEYFRDQNVASGWEPWQAEDTIGRYVVDNSTPYSGESSQRITAQSMLKGGMNVYQNIKVVPKETYYLSAQMKVNQIQNADVMIAIHYFDDSYNLVGSSTPISINTVSNWKKVSESFVVPHNAATARIHLHTQRHTKEGESSADFIVDDVVVLKEK
ncbi:carbohydrate binding domain-containing protein [Paenibacillus sp. UMB4589-SE434]|uniref:carbohydrate binding domain-containing protein n=1 Tax=Paenibacillus sp. UMB4589-SE434 TaxID=3046314 RepID=UPI00254E0357|nr:carbohydrate binding domain-containing protein [Paenibacillus sp. UMB4589-SE434]MDK8183728.1 carbohydrate binding domain-containing protein [Paenibacillus sp. UMB4589-SE434]